ncbi:MAG: leucine-rich repeat domain-containing protein [Treponema sp.]|jgi:hypothetical protein|nr:leucine-rich repeat domain-containing protein [Treponema sp.]
MFTFTACPTDTEDDGDDDNAVTLVELTAGAAVSAAATDTSKAVTFTGATGLTLTAADFAVTTGGTISTVVVASGTATVTVTFAANTDTTAKTYTVSIAAASTTIKGSAKVTITQAAKGFETVAELTAHLATLSTGSAAIPTRVPLTLAFNTGDTVPSGQIPWAEINTAVANSKKYVILDLSASIAAHDTTANTIEGSYDSDDEEYYELSGNYFNIIGNNTYIKGITLPSTLTSIGDYAFVECSGLTSVDIPGSVTSIGVGAFGWCSSLTAFTVAASNTAYSSAQDGILYDKDKMTIISVPGGKSGILNNLPNTLTSIGDEAFADCSGLTSVTIGAGVISIGKRAFYDCDELTTVIFEEGSNITSWNTYTFPYGDNLWTAYNTANKPGIYILSGSNWTKQP